jgi:hypothetical protein
VEVWQAGERVCSTLVDYGRLTAFTCADEAATISLNGTAVCGDVCLIVYHARQHGALSKTTVGVRMCSLTFHTGSLPPGRPAHRWRLSQLDAVGGNEHRFEDRFRLVLNCVASDEVSSREVVWPRPEARQLLFNSEQDFEATLRLVPRSRSKFFINNPGWGTGGETTGTGVAAAATTSTDQDEIANGPPVAPPRTARQHNAQHQHIAESSQAAESAASPDCDDLLGLDSLPQQPTVSELTRPVGESARPVSPAPADLLVGLSPPASASEEAGMLAAPSEASGFDFLADLDQPAPSAAASVSAQESQPPLACPIKFSCFIYLTVI